MKKNNNLLICADSAHTTGCYFSHIEKCGETTDLTPLQSHGERLTLDSDVPKGESGTPAVFTAEDLCHR